MLRRHRRSGWTVPSSTDSRKKNEKKTRLGSTPAIHNLCKTSRRDRRRRVARQQRSHSRAVATGIPCTSHVRSDPFFPSQICGITTAGGIVPSLTYLWTPTPIVRVPRWSKPPQEPRTLDQSGKRLSVGS
ncbi:hypothetical protein GY45DRAFT_63101 [Cubamyces sp. BRFM 1775]|nr:hypothetical protein GY45DRAFT_63101 [Cubamyces sp. BRFM 1775]